jgi:hypothetical protein
MKISLFVTLFSALLVLIIASGCTQQAVQPTPTFTTVPTIPATPVPTAVTTTLPVTTVPLPTITPTGLPLVKSIKDTPLLFTISAPEGYSGTTIRARTYEYSILYKTTIFNPANGDANTTINNNSGFYIPLSDSLTVFSYSSSLSVDQNIRNIIRSSGAVFTESSVTYNGITYVRFDAASDPYSGLPAKTVIHVANKGSSNERGFLPVIIYTMTPDGTLSPATYENMVQSFRYYTARTIGSASGVETDRPSFYQ